MADDVVIREAERTDIAEIVSIYNDVLATTSAIWREQPTSVGERDQWLDDKRTARHLVLVVSMAISFSPLAATEIPRGRT